MNKITLAIACLTVVAISSCKKSKNDTNNPYADWEKTTSAQVIADFANVLVLPNYTDLKTRANALNLAILDFNTNPTEDNLLTARNAWRNTRAAWEQSEAFIFGPVEDFNYDPSMDTWPLDKTSLDSLLGSSNALTLTDVDSLPFSLKGFHAIEYVLFGTGGNKTAASITSREKQYIVSLTQSLYNTCSELQASWDPNQPGNFPAEMININTGSSRFASRKEVLLATVNAMAGICEEVANGKMEEPLGGGTPDSTLCESGFSHNSTADFKNNITGVLNSYFAKYTSDGHGLNEIVGAKNASLHNKIESQINAAINAFNSIDASYEKAIYTQQVQIHNAQDAINALKTTLETELIDFIQLNVKD